MDGCRVIVWYRFGFAGNAMIIFRICSLRPIYAACHRAVPDLPVYGLGMPTVEGVSGVLRTLAGGGEAAGRKLAALWVNMREEPVVYINGRPFVLREEVRIA
jgi:hypothetical protein